MALTPFVQARSALDLPTREALVTNIYNPLLSQQPPLFSPIQKCQSLSQQPSIPLRVFGFWSFWPPVG
jgi:hypothetical protein